MTCDGGPLLEGVVWAGNCNSGLPEHPINVFSLVLKEHISDCVRFNYETMITECAIACI